MTIKRKLAGVTATMLMTTGMAVAAVGVSVSVGEPGFYGRLDIGDFPRPQLVYAQPVIIERPVGVVYEPVYLRVPASQSSEWRRYCRQYGACNRPVYFVQDRWYNDVYVPRYRERHRDRDGHPGKGWAKGHDKGHGKGHGRD
jgi:hypothetical protein